MGDLPDYFFRVRDNGALVFRVDTGNRNSRLEMDPIAVANIRNGEVKPQGDRALSPEDLAAIRDWMAERSATLAARERDEMARVIEHLNQVAQWAQSKATAEELEQLTEPVLLAMHDLRNVLVRKKAERIADKADG